MLKEVLVPKTVCDEPHTQDRDGRRFFITDPTGKRYRVDWCDRHEQKLLRHATPVGDETSGQADGQVDAPDEPGVVASEAARRLHVGKSQVQKLAKEGRLVALARGSSGHEAVYSAASIEAEEARRAGKSDGRSKGPQMVASENGKGGYHAPSNERWMNAPEAAERLQITVSRVSDLARKGKIKARRVGPRRSQYDRKSVEARARAVGL